jgi:hypothetical protein
MTDHDICIFDVTFFKFQLTVNFWRHSWVELWLYVGRTKSHEPLFFACNLGTADKGEYSDRWNQLLC